MSEIKNLLLRRLLSTRTGSADLTMWLNETAISEKLTHADTWPCQQAGWF